MYLGAGCVYVYINLLTSQQWLLNFLFLRKTFRSLCEHGKDLLDGLGILKSLP